jgi:small-conductance mechanosensitive channel
MDPTSSAFWLSILKGFEKIFTHPGMDIQLFFSAVAIAMAFLLSLLIQRLVLRKISTTSKHRWIATDLLPAILSPVLVIVGLLMASWVSIMVLPIHQRTIASFARIAFVWLIARLLLLIAQRHFMAYFISAVMLVLTLLSVTHLLAPTQASLNDISFETSTFRLSLLGAIKGTFTLIVLFWGAGILSKTGEKWLRKMTLSFNARELALKFMRILLYSVACVLTLNQMGVDLTSLTVFGGALAVGIGFGLQKITSNFISGIILLFEKTIQEGDLIEVGGEKGWVRQMAIRYTLLETFDGRELLVPNETLITGQVISWTYTNPRARVDITMTIVFNSDVNLVRTILIDAAKAHPHCVSDPPPNCYLTEFADRGFKFQLVFWIPDVKEGITASRSEVMGRIVGKFREHNIVFSVAS